MPGNQGAQAYHKASEALCDDVQAVLYSCQPVEAIQLSLPSAQAVQDHERQSQWSLAQMKLVLPVLPLKLKLILKRHRVMIIYNKQYLTGLQTIKCLEYPWMLIPRWYNPNIKFYDFAFC